MSGYPYGPVAGLVTMQPPRVCVGLGWRVPQPCREQAAKLWGGCLAPPSPAVTVCAAGCPLVTPCLVWDAGGAAQSPWAIFPTHAAPWWGFSCRLSRAESEMGDKEREAPLLRLLLEQLICGGWGGELRAELVSWLWTLGAMVPPRVGGLRWCRWDRPCSGGGWFAQPHVCPGVLVPGGVTEGLLSRHGGQSCLCLLPAAISFPLLGM